MRRRKPLHVALALGIILVIITAIIVLVAGYRYFSNDGVKYAGEVDKTGQPINGTIHYPDGSTAKLDYANRTITYDNGDLYEGDISGTNRNGNGKMTYANGDVYEGGFVNDEMSGTGKMIYANGDVYEGSMQDSQKHGYGVFKFFNGDSYEGYYEKDVMSGTGVFTWSSGARYEGQFADDVKSGTGKMTFANGDVYEGNFSQDMRNGSGHYTWADGTTYTGTFRNNLMDTRRVDENGNFIIGADGEYAHGSVAYYTTVSESGIKTYTGYFMEGVIIANYNG